MEGARPRREALRVEAEPVEAERLREDFALAFSAFDAYLAHA